MARVRIGVLGCGAIAQVQHLPNLLELDEEFAVPIVCDVSPDQAAYVAKRFAIPSARQHPRRPAERGYRRGSPLSCRSQKRRGNCCFCRWQARADRKAHLRVFAGS